MKNPKIPNAQPTNKEGFVTWQDGDKASLENAMKVSGEALEASHPIQRSSAASYGFPYKNGDITIRSSMDRQDYEFFRINESVPKQIPHIIAVCMAAYQKIGIVKNVIDTMSDFTAQGIKIVHHQPEVEQFYQTWFEQVDGPGRSERFANLFYRAGNVVVKKDFAKLSNRVIDELKRGYTSATAADIYDFIPDPIGKQPKYVVPYTYSFMNPSAVKVIGGQLGMFAGKSIYAIEIPEGLIKSIMYPVDDFEKLATQSLPPYIVQAIKSGQKVLKLDSSKISTAHYKKDDWDEWGLPITYGIIDDLIMLQKMKLADLAALDGIISHIRIWKLGSLEHKMMPTAAAIEKLSAALSHSTGGGSFDLIWDAGITLEETSSEIYKILGSAKYESILNSIYATMGIPQTLTGKESGGGLGNNFLGLKILMERLNYGRDALIKFWNKEIKIVQKAMGHRFPAQIEFKHMVLSDEAAQNQIILNLLDRDVISLERVREHFGYNADVEEATVKSEYKKRTNKKLPPKVSPFHDSQPEHSLHKIFAQNGTVTPGQLGLELEKKKPGELTNFDMQKLAIDVKKQVGRPEDVANKPSGQPGQGRPPGKKDSTKRKQKRIVPQTKASEFITLELWASEAQKAIGDIVSPVYLHYCNKKNIRSLTTSEFEELEYIKFSVLCSLDPYVPITKELIAELFSKPLIKYVEAENYWKASVAAFIHQNGVQPTVDDIRSIQSYVYSLFKCEYDPEGV